MKKVSTGKHTLTFFVKEGLRLEFAPWTLELSLYTSFFTEVISVDFMCPIHIWAAV